MSIEKQLRAIFQALLFRGLGVLLAKATEQPSGLRNAAEDWLREALRTGRVQYVEGVFSGDFSAAISRALRGIGAKFDKAQKVFLLPPGEVPNWVKGEATSAATRAKDLHRALLDQLDLMETEMPGKLQGHNVDGSEALSQAEKSWRVTARKLETMPELTPEGKARLVQQYSANMKIWIEKFSREEIQALRRTVEENAEAGYRYDTLIRGLKSRQAVTETKARFLARQETALFVSKFRRESAADAGIQRYRWSTSRDERVRSSHKHLNNRVFFYNDPPIVDPATGRHGNPGEDFGCRCVDIPILEKVAQEEAA